MKKLSMFLIVGVLVLGAFLSSALANESELVITDVKAAWVDIAGGAESDLVIVISTSNPEIKGTSATWYGKGWYGGLRINEVWRLSEFLIGKSPYDVEKTTAELHSMVDRFYADKAIEDYDEITESGPQPTGDASTIDLALKSYRKAVSGLATAQWDIIGKVAGKPFYEILGGPGGKVKAYVSSGTIGAPIEERVKEVLDYLKKNYGAIKFRYGDFPDPERALELGKAIREAVGKKLDILIDANEGYSLEEALKMVKVFEEINVSFLEEPLERRDLTGLIILGASTTVPIAGSEVGYGVRTFETYLEDDLYDIVQPDLNTCGGIMEARRIMLMAQSKGKKCIPHNWIGGLGMAATLQMIGSIPNHSEVCPYLEFPLSKTRTVEVRDMTIKTPFQIDENGYISIPTGPGLGVELKDEIMELIEKGMTKIEIDKDGEIIKATGGRIRF